MKNDFNFYSLLFISKEDSNPNLDENNYNNKIEIYINNALLLDKSLRQFDYNLILLTNKKKILKKYLLNSNLIIKEIKFRKKVKKNINFYSSHFKIDTFKYFSKLKTNSCLVDLDCIAINNPPRFFDQLMSGKRPILYDITNKTLERYKKKIVIQSLELLIEKKIMRPKWFGGEFISGNSSFFKILYKTINIFENKYYKKINYFFHNGDEMLVNSALNYLINKSKIKLYLNANKLGITSRYWSNLEVRFMKPKALGHSFLIHLPADKRFLSNYYKSKKDVNKFKKNLIIRNSSICFYFKNKIKDFYRKIFR